MQFILVMVKLTPFFSVTWSFRNNCNILIWCSSNINGSYDYQCWKQQNYIGYTTTLIPNTCLNGSVSWFAQKILSSTTVSTLIITRNSSQAPNQHIRLISEENIQIIWWRWRQWCWWQCCWFVDEQTSFYQACSKGKHTQLALIISVKLLKRCLCFTWGLVFTLRGKGLIINISSEAASQPQPMLSVYSATKVHKTNFIHLYTVSHRSE